MNKSKNINDLFSVKKLNIVITGASRGIGFYLADFLYNSGSNLLLLGRSKKIKKKNYLININPVTSIIFHSLKKHVMNSRINSEKLMF